MPTSRRFKLLITLAGLLALAGAATYFVLAAIAGPTEAERVAVRESVAGLGLTEARDFAANCLDAADDKDEAAADAAAARAVALFEEHLEAHPGDVDALLDLARVQLGCKIPFAGMMARGALAAEAESLYVRALETDPDSLRAHLDYGVLLYNLPPFLGRTADAVERLRWATEHDAAPAEAFVLLGELYSREQDYELAAATWRRGLESHPGSADLRERAGDGAFAATASPGTAVADTAEVAEVSPPQPMAAAFRDFVEQPMAAGLSVAVALGDEPLALGGYGLADLEHVVPASADTVYRLGSVSKQFTAALVLKLVERGVLGLDDPLRLHLVDAGHYGDATVHEVLGHTAGLPENPAGFELGGRAEPGAFAGWLERSLALDPIGAPGERYLYSNLGYALLGELVERVTAEDFEALMEREILRPQGLDATHFCDEDRLVPHRADGYKWQGAGFQHDDPLLMSPALRSAGALCSTVGDLLAWQRALRGGRVLSPELTERMATPAEVTDGTSTYGYGLHRRRQNGLDVIHHGGHIQGFVAELAYYPSLDLHVVLLANSEAVKVRPLAAALATGMAGGMAPADG